MKLKYIPRVIEKDLRRSLRVFPVVVLTGPRQTGKSTLLQHSFKQYSYVTLEDPFQRDLVYQDPQLFFANLSPRGIIDEIQYSPELLSLIKLEVDKNPQRKGGFIVTGSQSFSLMSNVSESLAGRAGIHSLLGLSCEELSFKKKRLRAEETFSLIFRGFYPDPAIHRIDPDRYYRSYLQTYLERDIRQLLSVKDLRQFQTFIELLAARTGNVLNINEVVKECGVSFPTGRRWVSLLESTGILFLLRPYFRNITKRVIKSPKIYFTDTGLVAHILRYPNSATLLKGPHKGALFENFILIELLKFKYNHGLNYELFFFQDSHKNEIDLIIQRADKPILMEIKATSTPTLQHTAFLRKTNLNFKDAVKYLVCLSSESKKFSEDGWIIHWQDVIRRL